MTRTLRCALACVLTACAAEPRAPASPAPVTSASAAPAVSAVGSVAAPPPAPPRPPLAELIDRTLAETESAWMARDAQRLAATYAAGAELRVTLPADGWTSLKKPDVQPQLAQLFAAFPDARVTTTRTLRRGNVVAAEGYFTGAASGKKVGCPIVTLSRFDDDGHVKEQHVVFDGGTILGQLGKRDPGVKVHPAESIPTAPIVNLTAGSTPDEASDVAAVKAFYASSASTKAASVDDAWGAGAFVVVELTLARGGAEVHGVDVLEVREGKVRPPTSYGPDRAGRAKKR